MKSSERGEYFFLHTLDYITSTFTFGPRSTFATNTSILSLQSDFECRLLMERFYLFIVTFT